MIGSRPQPDRRGWILWAAIVATAVAATPGGCNIAGPLTYLAFGTPMIPAEYELADRPTVVYVDDRANVIESNAPALRIEIADKLSEELMSHEVLSPENTISPRDTLALVRNHDRHSELLPIDAIGRLVGAEQVIYIEMLQFVLTPDGVTPRPAAACRVRVIDVNNRERLYPTMDETQQTSRQIGTQLNEVDDNLFRTSSSRRAVYGKLADRVGKDIAKLFYRHDSRELGDRLSPE